MKKFLTAFSLSLLITGAAFGQNTTLKLSLANSTSTSCHIWLPDVPAYIDTLHSGSVDIPLSKNGTGARQFAFTKPEWASLWCAAGDSSGAKSFHYWLYLSPGDQINFKADFKSKDNGIVVSGKGSNNNQPLLSALVAEYPESLYGDTLPNRITVLVNQHRADLKNALDKYIGLYKPTADFIKNEEINIKYDAVNRYFDFKENNKYQINETVRPYRR